MTRTPETKASRPKRPRRVPTTSPSVSPVLRKAEPAVFDPATVVLAAITGAHGVGGEVKVKPFTDDLSAFRSFNDGTLTLVSMRGLVARFEEIDGRDAAERLRGTLLTVPRTLLPPLDEGEYYHTDLIGLAVFDEIGEQLGHVAAVEDFGAGDLLDVERADGRRFMVPVAAAQGVLAPCGQLTVAADWAI